MERYTKELEHISEHQSLTSLLQKGAERRETSARPNHNQGRGGIRRHAEVRIVVDKDSDSLAELYTIRKVG